MTRKRYSNAALWFLVLLMCVSVDAIDMSLLEKQKSLLNLTQIGNIPFRSSDVPNATVDNSIDPETYLIGGGDEFFVSSLEMPSMQYTARVDMHNNLFIPDLGLIELGKVPLSDAYEKIRDFVRLKMRKQATVYVSLVNVKSATITVNGAVENPGTYVLPGSHRLLDALKTANNGSLPSLNDRNLREVLCTNQGNSQRFDLLGYVLKNEIAGNPYIYPGDNLTVSLATRRVLVNGPLRTTVEGWIPIRMGETLSDFLSLFTLDASADSSSITIQTVSPSTTTYAKHVSWDGAAQVLLQDRDVITIPTKKDYPRTHLVGVYGEIARPGTYPIRRGVTSAEEIIVAAGGPTEYGNIKRAFVVRNSKQWKEGGSEKSPFPTGLKAINISSVRPEIDAAIARMALTRDYLTISLSEKAVTLESDDLILIPPRESFVYVSGNVRRPGAYEYVQGKGHEYYIRKAGGYTSRADRTNQFAISSFAGASAVKDITNLAEGDIIVIPDSQQGKRLLTFFLPIFQAVATTAGIMLTIIGLAASRSK